MTPFKRGDVVLVAFPFTDLTTTKMRPALIISSDRFNQKRRDIIAVAITSNIPKRLFEEDLLLSTRDQRDAGLPKPSLVKLGKVVTLDQRLVRKKLGRLSEETLDEALMIFHKLLS